MALLVGSSSLAAAHGEGSWYGIKRIHKLFALYLVICIAHKSFPKAKGGLKMGPLLTLAQICVAMQLSNRETSRPIERGELVRIRYELPRPRSDYLIGQSPPSHMILRCVAYSVLEEGLLRGVLQVKIKQLAKRYLSDRLATCTAIATTALVAGTLAKVFPRGKSSIESHNLTVLVISESAISGLIADRMGVESSIAARLAHHAISWTIEELHAYLRRVI